MRLLYKVVIMVEFIVKRSLSIKFVNMYMLIFFFFGLLKWLLDLLVR